MSRTKPFIKWAGGKAKALNEVLSRFPSEFGDYWEPFLGGGAVFLGSGVSRAWLSDANPHLVNVWICVKHNPSDLAEALRFFAEKHSKVFFYEQRAAHNEGHGSAIEKAARFVYLNKSSFCGLWRENGKAQFNSPWGSCGKPVLPNLDLLEAASARLKYADLKVCDFSDICPKPGDLVYMDPPYLGTFSKYQGKGFGEADQIRVRDLVVKFSDQGVFCLLSNSAAAKPLYDDLFQVIEIEVPRGIKGEDCVAAKASEILVKNW